MKTKLELLLLMLLIAVSCEDSTHGQQPVKFTTNTIDMKLNKIPAGTFLMGSPETEPSRWSDETHHEVTISKPFYMQTTEVTQSQWKAVMGSEPWSDIRYVKEGPNYPATWVSWDDAVVFCKKLSEKEGKTYRLPTEAEWEYACRAGTKTTWHFGNDEKKLRDYAWYRKNASDVGEKYVHQVELKKPNPWGLYDMHGNVQEWCNDCYREDYYKQSPEKDPQGWAYGDRVVRGGSWGGGTDLTRSAHRDYQGSRHHSQFRGFRLVRELDSTEKAASVTAALAKGDWETVLALDATNIEGLRLKATAITASIAKGDWETVLALDATNSDGLRMQITAEKAAILAGDPITNTLDMTFINIPAGTFLMGTPRKERLLLPSSKSSAEHQHKVTITKAFYMQTTEVTQRQWKTVMGTEPWKDKLYKEYGPNYAASYVSWDDAVAFCNKLSEQEGKTYRLPTEAEWEYACRAGTETRWSFGDDENKLGDYAWYEKNALDILFEKFPHEVGLKKPNAFGLYDMHGNVQEWCNDYYGHYYYRESSEEDPQGPSLATLLRIIRGGSWGHDSPHTRSASRSWYDADDRGYDIGFRLVRELDDSPQSAPPTEPPAEPETESITNTIGMKLNKIPAGTFLMGSPESETGRQDYEQQHKVTISKAFYIQTTEVTQGQWTAVMGTEPWKGEDFVKEGPGYAATCVSWDDAIAFCKKLNDKKGKTYRLPTEAEWEYACRAGTKTTWSFGNNEKVLGDYAWYADNAYDIDEKYAHQVGLKKPNAFGLYDMHGNVWEWCHDYYRRDYYKQSPEQDPPGPASGYSRVLRGGSWGHGTRLSRSVSRSEGVAADRNYYVFGFRLVRELD